MEREGPTQDIKKLTSINMKSTKLFFHGKRLKDVYVGATKWEVIKYKVTRMVKRVIGTLAVGSAAAWLVFLGAAWGSRVMPVTVYAEKRVEVPVSQASPVLDRIANCESGKRGKDGRGIAGSASQFAPDGQVTIHVNTDGTVDIGKYGINKVWNAKATSLGLDLTKEIDNGAMAQWIYANRGTQDWYSSEKCWM